MADLVKFFDNTEDQILSLSEGDEQWVDKAFYFPTDKNFFYRIRDGVMQKYPDDDEPQPGAGVGVKMNGKFVGGVPVFVGSSDILDVSENFHMNTFVLNIEGVVNLKGTINLM